MQKLTPEQTAELLKYYPQMTTELQTLEIAIRRRTRASEVIYGLSVAQAAGGMPHSSGTSDKTQRVALEYEKQMDGEEDGLLRRIALIRGAQTQIDLILASNSLSTEEQDLIQTIYLKEKGLGWDAFFAQNKDKYGVYSKNTFRAHGKRALEKVAALLNITAEELREIKKEGQS